LIKWLIANKGRPIKEAEADEVLDEVGVDEEEVEIEKEVIEVEVVVVVDEVVAVVVVLNEEERTTKLVVGCPLPSWAAS